MMMVLKDITGKPFSTKHSIILYSLPGFYTQEDSCNKKKIALCSMKIKSLPQMKFIFLNGSESFQVKLTEIERL
jgi:hypothetical protein